MSLATDHRLCRGSHPMGSLYLVEWIGRGLTTPLELVTRCTACGATWTRCCPDMPPPTEDPSA